MKGAEEILVMDAMNTMLSAANSSSVGMENFHVVEVFGLGCFVLIASIVTFAACWHFLDYSAGGPVAGSSKNVVGAYSLALVGAFNTMLQSLIVHILAPELNWIEGLFWSSLIRFFMALPFVVYDAFKTSTPESTPLLPKEQSSTTNPPWHQKYGMLTLRGFMGTFGGHMALFWGVQFLLPSEAAALWSTAPFFALLFGYLLLGEVLSTLSITFICISFVGVLLVIEPIELLDWTSTGSIGNFVRVAACLLVLLGGACQGALGPMMRALKWTVFEVVLWAAGAGLITSLSLAAAFYPSGAASCWAWAAPTFAASPAGAAAWLALLGVSSFASTYFLNWAWQLEPAGAVDMVNMSSFVAVMFVFQLAVLSEPSGLLPAVGVVTIVAAGAGVIYSRLAARAADAADAEAGQRG